MQAVGLLTFPTQTTTLAAVRLQAQQAVRTELKLQKHGHQPKQPITVYIAAGDYFNQSLVGAPRRRVYSFVVCSAARIHPPPPPHTHTPTYGQVFTEADSPHGDDGRVIWRGAPGAKLYGGARVLDWTRHTKEIWQATLAPELVDNQGRAQFTMVRI
jgi:hypothetical protein